MLMLTLMLMLMLLLLLLPDSCCCCCFCFCFCGYLWTVLNTLQVESRISECALSFSAKYIWRTIRKDVTNQQQKQQRWRPIVWNASFLVLSSLPIGRFWPTRNTVLNFLKNGPIFQFQKYVFRMRGLEFETVFSECSSTIHNSNIWFGPNCVDGFFFRFKKRQRLLLTISWLKREFNHSIKSFSKCAKNFKHKFTFKRSKAVT